MTISMTRRFILLTLAVSTLLVAGQASALASGTIAYETADDVISWTDTNNVSSTVDVSFNAAGVGTADDQVVFDHWGSAIAIDASAAGICTATGNEVACDINDMAEPADYVDIYGLDYSDVLRLDETVTEVNFPNVDFTIMGGDGDDQLRGSDRADALYGENGNDQVYGEERGDIVSGGADDDSLHPGPGSDNVTGEAGADLIAVDVDGDVDLFDGGEVTDSYGDTIDYSDGAEGVTVTLGNGNNNDGPDGETVDATFENIEGTGSNDSLDGDAQDNQIVGGGGDDSILGGAGGDDLRGSDGDDDIAPGSGLDEVLGGAGDDTIRLTDDNAVDDLDAGETGENVGDMVSYAANVDGETVTLDDGSANDGDDQEEIDETFENVEGSLFTDIITGDGNANVLYGLSGADFLSGAGGDDTVNGGLGADTVSGGAGTDTLSHKGLGVPVVANISSNIDSSDASEVGNSDFETLEGTELDDQLSGNESGNTLIGLAGNDSLYGNGGDDTILANDGAADAVVDCGDSQGDTTTLDDGLDVNITACEYINGDSQDACSNFFGFQASAVSGTVLSAGRCVGTGAANTQTGTSGADQMFGYNGADVLRGLGGSDELYGGNGNDRLVGGAGNDRLNAGKGRNRLEGGAGADNLQARNGRRDRLYCGAGRDRVRADRIDFIARGCERVRFS